MRLSPMELRRCGGFSAVKKREGKGEAARRPIYPKVTEPKKRVKSKSDVPERVTLRILDERIEERAIPNQRAAQRAVRM
jgi:hypothetical protein